MALSSSLRSGCCVGVLADFVAFFADSCLYELPLDKRFGVGKDRDVMTGFFECLNAMHDVGGIRQRLLMRVADDFLDLGVGLVRHVEDDSAELRP